MKKWDVEFEKAVIEASTYREFIALFFKKKAEWNSPRPLSFQKFADLAGFGSKSFMNEILSGRRHLTLNSFEKISAGLRLNPTAKSLFRCLVSIEEPTFRSDGRDAHFYKRKLTGERRKLRSASHDTWLEASSAAARLSLESHVTDIHVCAGHPDIGASFEEIHSKMRIGKTVLQERIAQMVKFGLLLEHPETGRFHNGPPASNAKHTYSDPPYRDYVARAMTRASARMDKPLSAICLFATQTFLVKQSSVEALSNELNRVVREFADLSDDENGDGIAEVLVTLTHNFDSPSSGSSGEGQI
jgi:uncharacterized protein (TIGR02147 family)